MSATDGFPSGPLPELDGLPYDRFIAQL
jgi:hypothetical protein